MIISTGMASFEEIEEAVEAARTSGCEDISLLKCSSAYPAIPENMNLATIADMKDRFGLITGLSDHSIGSTAAVTAVALGAKIIEKHICISREIENPDSSFSLEKEEFAAMVRDIRDTERAIGRVTYNVSEQEAENKIFRRSIFVVKDINAGEQFTENNIRVIRPAYGMHPRYYCDVLGKTAVENLKMGTPLDTKHIL